MFIRKVIKYMTEDGEIFDTEEEAKKHIRGKRESWVKDQIRKVVCHNTKYFSRNYTVGDVVQFVFDKFYEFENIFQQSQKVDELSDKEMKKLEK